MNVHGGQFAVQVDGKGLGEKISEVGRAGDVFDNELALPHAVAKPVESHVDGFGSFGANGVGSQT